ncbi:hypothetical protein F4782DRAFT_487605 [Xylaria castorea]|nr:hypothetical protein F4782DRAFT_487605 [Xylaria castorea]
MPSRIPIAQLAFANALCATAVIQRNGACDGNWVPDTGFEDYTQTANDTQVMSSVVNGPTKVSVGGARTQEWSQTVEQSLSFEGLLTLGVSFSSSIFQSVTDSQTIEYEVGEGESGYVAWTSFLRCSRGELSCFTLSAFPSVPMHPLDSLNLTMPHSNPWIP